VRPAGLAAGCAGRRGARDQRELHLDRLVQAGGLLVDHVKDPQVRLDLEGVDAAEPPGERLLQLLAAGLEPRVAGRGQRPGAALPGHERIQEPPPAGPGQAGDHRRDLQQRVFEDLLHPGLVLGQP
jgi:hypothetical protein